MPNKNEKNNYKIIYMTYFSKTVGILCSILYLTNYTFNRISYTCNCGGINKRGTFGYKMRETLKDKSKEISKINKKRRIQRILQIQDEKKTAHKSKEARRA